jgi:hypothetical protein
MSESHTSAIGALAGTVLFLVGDSTVRYQFLELAYFTIHGTCAVPLHADDIERSAFLLDKWCAAIL